MAFKLGLRIADVREAASFYRGLGFQEVGSVPDANGEPVFVFLERGGVNLCVDSLRGMPFPDSERERLIQQGPRGLGVYIGLVVDDLDATYDYCRTHGCEITAQPLDAPWGDRVFECVDPFGYVWEISTPLPGAGPEDPFAAARASWFGTASD